MKIQCVRFYQAVPVSKSNRLETFLTAGPGCAYAGLEMDFEKGLLEFITADMDNSRFVPVTNIMYFEKVQSVEPK